MEFLKKEDLCSLKGGKRIVDYDTDYNGDGIKDKHVVVIRNGKKVKEKVIYS
jgi:hypothetical protein